ncbi:MAG: hypothetical protein LC802_12745 [Acidobacteria bacterium]|nr:hypothetical protein [Acidobacteriota bacterium]
MKPRTTRTDASETTEDARRSLDALLAARAVWFLRESPDGSAVELRRGEWELRAAAGSLLFSFWGAAGARTWRVRGWAREGEKLILEATRRAGAERARLELVARASHAEARLGVADARRAACARLTALACAERAGSKVEQSRLSVGARRGEPGRYARIVLKRGRALVAVTGPVVELGAEDADALLASALLWFARLGERAAGSRRGWRCCAKTCAPRFSSPKLTKSSVTSLTCKRTA